MAFAAIRNGDFIEISGADEKPEAEQESQQRGQMIESQDQSKQIDYSAVNANKSYSVFSFKENQFSIYSSNPGKVQGISLETPKERLARLQAELNDFKSDMQFIVEKEKSIQISKDDTNSVILAQISRVQDEIEQLVCNEDIKKVLESKIGSSSKGAANFDSALGILKKDLQQDLTNVILKRLQAMNANQEGSDSQPNSELKKASKIEIYIDPTQEKLTGDAKYVDVEKRISNLEKAIGISKLRKSEQEANGPFESAPLTVRVDTLSQQISLLSSDVILKRVVDLESQIEKIATKRTALAQANQILPQDLKKIDTLHDRFQSLAGIADELPSIVDRMEALKVLHEESAGLMNHIYSLTSLHQKVVQGISNNQNLLDQVNSNFSSNLQKVLSNLKLIDDRINALQSRSGSS